MLYTSGSQALAALEVIVHLNVQPLGYLCASIEIPNAVAIETVAASSLPSGWDVDPPITFTREFGTAWAREKRTAVLRVPSAVVPAEWNYILNPEHAQFRTIRFISDKPFKFDPRLRP